jgi:hypothetical protein
MAALEQLALDRHTPAALKQAVAQLVTIDPEIALEGGVVLEDFDVIGCHGAAAFVNMAGKLPKRRRRRHRCGGPKEGINGCTISEFLFQS